MSRLHFEMERRFPRGPTIRLALDLPLDGDLVTVLFGPSGAGKTTVLRCLAGLERPDAGRIRFGEETWFDGAAGVFVPPQQRGVGLLFQEYALFPHLTVAGNVGYGLAALPRRERVERVREVAELLQIDGLLERHPDRISGGQRQRVALARALAPRPRLLLLDEPLSALDAPTREGLRGELRRLLESAAIPALLVTHDRVEALALGDRMAVMADGILRQVGAVQEVFSSPADLVVARVVATENVALARVLRKENGLVVLAVGSTQLVAVDPGGLGSEAYVCIRAEEIVLEPAPGAPTSAQNLLAARVVALSPEGALVRVVLDCGFQLVALVTRQSAEQLALTPGREVAALVKAPAVRLVTR